MEAFHRDTILVENVPLEAASPTSTTTSTDAAPSVAEENDVVQLCSSFGILHSVRVLVPGNKATFEVQYESKGDAAAAVDNMMGMMFFGRALRCRFAPN